MSKILLNNARISGIVCAVPDNKRTIAEVGEKYFDRAFIERIGNTVGTNTLYFTKENQSSGDLGIAAAKKLMEELDWEAESVGALIFNSQTADFVIPPTSVRIQHALGLSTDTFVADTNYGCMAFPIGLMMAYQMIALGQCGRIILIDAECHHKAVSRSDADTALFFGDAAAATAIEESPGAPRAAFKTFVDGEHVSEIFLKSFKDIPNEKNTLDDRVYMNGEAVTRYMFRQIPKFAADLLASCGCEMDDIDAVLMHQANAYMLKFLGKRMHIDPAKVLINIGHYGNTSSVSIPLLLVDELPGLFAGGRKKLMMIGFGAGFMIAGAIMEAGDLKGGQVIFV
ncbi:MAG: ketoacyl-ACP synthase III [Clostridiales Family XIII bacterium]|nr:ketoacyl-ACP synthase III [Clostridiales Family XIII bacterium]